VAGIDLPIPHHFMTKNPDLLKPEEYGQITHVYSHSAAIGQCQEIILKIKKVNPDVKIIRTESTADGAIIVSNLSGEEAMTSIAIGSLQAAQSLQLPHTDKPVQDYEDNRTTFLLINKPNNTDLKTFQTIKNTMRVDKVENEPNAKINFIINLNLTNDLGSLSCLIEELSSIPDLNMNFVQVEYAGGQNNIHPHISGVLPKLNISLLDTTLQRYTTDLKLTYTKVELDKKENSPQELLQMKSDSNNIEIKISKKDESDSLAITSIVPNTPGALASVLKEIKKKGINLTSLKIMAHGAQEYATLEATGSNYK
jgi:prephenate dehydratase